MKVSLHRERIYFCVFALLFIALVLHVTFFGGSENKSRKSSRRRIYSSAEKLFSDLKKGQNSVHSESKCGQKPSSSSIYYMGDWQIFKTTEAVHFIYGAYYDSRAYVEGPVVRILLLSMTSKEEKLFCQFWFEDSLKPTLSNVTEQINLESAEESSSPAYMFTCPIPTAQKPTFVSLVTSPCENAHNMHYVYSVGDENQDKEDFLVVVKNFNSIDDKSLMIIEWLEILKQLGVSKVYFYIRNCHENVAKVLEFYEHMNFVSVKNFKYPEAITEKNENSMIPLHACLLENLNLYHFITPLDVNELIVPTKNYALTWKELLLAANDERIAQEHFDLADAFKVQRINFYVEKNSPKNFHFLENTQRSRKFSSSNDNVRSFMAIEHIKTINHQRPETCLGKEYCIVDEISKSEGQLSHYVDSCDELSEDEADECNERIGKLVKDTSLWKYKEIILRNSNDAIRYVFKGN